MNKKITRAGSGAAAVLVSTNFVSAATVGDNVELSKAAEVEVLPDNSLKIMMNGKQVVVPNGEWSLEGGQYFIPQQISDDLLEVDVGGFLFAGGVGQGLAVGLAAVGGIALIDSVGSSSATSGGTTAPLSSDSQQTATIGQAFSYAVPTTSFTGVDSNTQTLTAKAADGSALPSWLSFDANTKTFSGTPPTGATAINVVVTATDGKGGTATSPFTIGINNAPTATIILPQTATIGQAFSYAVPTTSFTGVDSNTLTLTAKAADGSALPSWLSFDANTKTFSGTPPTGATAVNVVLTATDGKGDTATSPFTIGINNAPTATTIATQTATIGQAFSYAVPATSFSDADGNTLTLTAKAADGSALPSWLSFDANTKTFSGTPPTTATAVNVVVTANDGKGGTATSPFTIGINNAPTNVRAIENHDLTTGYYFSFSVSVPGVTDVSGNTYSAKLADGSALPSWMSFNATTKTFSGRPPADTTPFNVIVTVSDTKGGTQALTFTCNINNSPTSKGIENQTAVSGHEFSFTVPETTFSDKDGDTLTYRATNSEGSSLAYWLKFDASTRTFSGTPPMGAPEADVLVFASDGRDGFTSAPFKITVTPNTAPTATTILDQLATTGREFSYTFPETTFTDANKDTLTYSAKASDGSALPTWLKFNAGTRTFSGTPPTAASAVNVVVTASDGAGGTATSPFTININQLPAAGTIGYQTATIGQQYSFTIPETTFTDGDGDTLTYSATIADDSGSALPTWFSFNASTRTFSGTPGTEDSGFNVRVTVDDGKGGINYTSFAVILNYPPAPRSVKITNTTVSAKLVEGGTDAGITATADQSGVTWSLEGDDAALFNIDNTGKITAKAGFDHEGATDKDKNGVYKIKVVATLGSLSDKKDFEVTVTDKTEMPSWFTESTTYGLGGVANGTAPKDGVSSLLSNDMASATSTTEASSWVTAPAGGARPVGQAVDLSYAFVAAGGMMYPFDSSDKAPVAMNGTYTETEKAFIRSVFTRFSEIANITYTEKTDTGASSADIRLGKSTAASLDAGSTTLGFAFQPSDLDNLETKNKTAFEAKTGDFWFVSDVLKSYQDFSTPYGDEKNTISHELGHAMGLDHPFNGDGFSPSPNDTGTKVIGTNRGGTQTGGGHDTTVTDTIPESIMSYYNPNDTAQLSISESNADVSRQKNTPWEPSLYDVAALQHLYGANMTFNADDTTYNFDGTQQTFKTIWDAGGNDKIVVTGDVNNYINLNEGTFSGIAVNPSSTYVFNKSDLGYASGATVTLTNSKYGTVVDKGDKVEVTFNLNAIPKGSTEVISVVSAGVTKGLELHNGTNWVAATYGEFTKYTAEYTQNKNVSIAYGVTIEEAHTGGGDDVLIGNSAANILSGGGGTNTLTGGAGADTFKITNIIDGKTDTITDFSADDKIYFDMFNSSGHLTSSGYGVKQSGADYVFYNTSTNVDEVVIKNFSFMAPSQLAFNADVMQA